MGQFDQKMNIQNSERAPEVSIICAAYNRAELLRLAISSLLLSTFSDWELIVVGDGCTDESENVVMSFGDPRITFENLPENTGGQAAPNNRGLERARGRFIAYLNQDDLFMPTHLESAFAFMEANSCDLSWCPVVLLHRLGREEGPPDPIWDHIAIDGMTPDGCYDPSVFMIATSWLVRREAAMVLGAWRSENDVRYSPSQDYLFRAAMGGMRLACRPDPTVICIHSGTRRLAYQTGVFVEHIRASSWLGDPNSEAALYKCASMTSAREAMVRGRALRDHSNRQIEELSAAYNVHPGELVRFLSDESKGGFVAGLRALTAESTQLDLDKKINAGHAISDCYFAAGWHGPQGDHRWSAFSTAELIFKAPSSSVPLFLYLRATCLSSDMDAKVEVVGGGAARLDAGAPQDVVIPLPVSGNEIRLVCSVKRCGSPKSEGLSDDDRNIGICLYSFFVSEKLVEKEKIFQRIGNVLKGIFRR